MPTKVNLPGVRRRDPTEDGRPTLGLMFNAKSAEIGRRLMLMNHGFSFGEAGNASACSSGILALPTAAANDGARHRRSGRIERQRAQLRTPTGGNIRHHLVDPGAQPGRVLAGRRRIKLASDRRPFITREG